MAEPPNVIPHRPYSRVSLFDDFDYDEEDYDELVRDPHDLAPPQILQDLPQSPPEVNAPEIQGPALPDLTTKDAAATTPRVRGRRSSRENLEMNISSRTKSRSSAPVVPSPLTLHSFPVNGFDESPRVTTTTLPYSSSLGSVEEILSGPSSSGCSGSGEIPKKHHTGSPETRTFPAQRENERVGHSRKFTAAPVFVRSEEKPGGGPRMSTRHADETHRHNVCGTCEMRKSIKEIKELVTALNLRMSNVIEKLGL